MHPAENREAKGRGLGFVLLITTAITVALICIKVFFFPDSQIN